MSHDRHDTTARYCCCCIKLKTGVLLISIVDCIWYALAGLSCFILAIALSSESVSKELNSMPFYLQYAVFWTGAFAVGLLVFVAVVCVIGFVFSVLGAQGTQ